MNEFISSPGGELWPYDRSPPNIPAGRLGDYGYMEKNTDGERFVCLGRLEDLLGTSCVAKHAFHRVQAQGRAGPWAYVPKWPRQSFTYVVSR